MRLKFFFLVCLAASFIGCDSGSLLDNINSSQSVEVLVVLQKHGIAASREQRDGGREARYDVFVASSDYNQALEILHEYNLPHEVSPSLSEVTKQRGFVPNSPEIMELRLDHALAIEAERLIAGLAGVVDAKVVIRSQLGSGRTWRGDQPEVVNVPQASVVIRFSKEQNISRDKLVDEVQSIVAKTVPGIASKSVEVIISDLNLSAMSKAENALGLHRVHGLSFHVPQNERRQAYQSLFVLIVSSVVIGVFFTLAIFLWVNATKKQEMERIRRHTTSFEKRSLLADSVSDNDLIDPSGRNSQ